MPHFKPRKNAYVQAIQLSAPLKVKTNKGTLKGIIGDWLVMSMDGSFVTICGDDVFGFWNFFEEFEDD